MIIVEGVSVFIIVVVVIFKFINAMEKYKSGSGSDVT